MIGLALVAVLLSADAVEPPAAPAAIFKVPADATIDLHDGDGPFMLPPRCYLFSEAAFEVVNSELKRLQMIESAPPKKAEVVPVQGYLIMAGIVAATFLAGGLGIGFYLGQRPR